MQTLDVMRKITVARNWRQVPSSNYSLSLRREFAGRYKALGTKPKDVENIRQLMAGIEPEQTRIRMRCCEQGRMVNGYQGIVAAVKKQSRLTKMREWREAGGVPHEFEIQGHVAGIRIVKYRHRAVSLPGGEAVRTKTVQP